MKITQTSRNWFNRLTNNGTTMGEFTHIISICCPDDHSIKPIGDNHLVVKMWDVDKVLQNKFRTYQPPDHIDCQYILNRVTDWVNDSGWDLNILIHCDVGVSRSPAITLGVLWHLSSMFFVKDTPERLLRDYIDARKSFCNSLVSEEFDSNFLKFYIEGIDVPRGVIPNQAILKHYRAMLNHFPW